MPWSARLSKLSGQATLFAAYAISSLAEKPNGPSKVCQSSSRRPPRSHLSGQKNTGSGFDMPGLSGVDLTHHLKRLDAGVPIIVVTGHADVPLAIEAMKAGAADFIEKPYDDELMLSAIRKALDVCAEGQIRAREQREIHDRLTLLSPREREVVDGLVEGKANKLIAFDLDISPRTVEVYRANAMMKLQARTLSDLVRMVTIAHLS